LVDKAIYKEPGNLIWMMKLTAYISGQVQWVGYRWKIIDIANAFGLKGYTCNAMGGRVKVVAEGDEQNLARFLQAIDIKEGTIYVHSIESKYSPATGDYDGFYKMIKPEEEDCWRIRDPVMQKEIWDALDDLKKSTLLTAKEISDTAKTEGDDLEAG
jgi:acylphosphatase